ncbi:MAG: hypothetical protein JO056_00895 [Alphaproteobacteria bacterium]|nr:hypothetical protein [Alphaproteobacteria bacterium]
MEQTVEGRTGGQLADNSFSPLKIAAALAAFFGLIGVSIYWSRDPEPTAIEKQAEQERIMQADIAYRLAQEEAPLIARAKASVLRTLRDPGSAEFGRVSVRYCRELDCKEGEPAHGTPMVCGGVNAKSGFGGYTGFKVFIYGNGKLIPPGVAEEHPLLAAKICL